MVLVMDHYMALSPPHKACTIPSYAGGLAEECFLSIIVRLSLCVGMFFCLFIRMLSLCVLGVLSLCVWMHSIWL